VEKEMIIQEAIDFNVGQKKPKMAICYDFDRTLSPDDMQTFTLIPSFGVDKNVFWQESDTLAEENLMDNNLAWMYELIKYSKFKGRSLSRDYFKSIGAEVLLYDGVEGWFEHINRYAEQHGIECERAYKVLEGRRPNIVDRIKNGDIAFVINTPGSHDAREDEARGNRVDIGRRIRDTVLYDGRAPSPYVSHGSEEQEGPRIHDVEANQLFEQVLLEQKHREPDSEQDDGKGFLIIHKQVFNHVRSLLS
jgi:hypothetical protein